MREQGRRRGREKEKEERENDKDGDDPTLPPSLSCQSGPSPSLSTPILPVCICTHRQTCGHIILSSCPLSTGRGY